MAEFYSARGWEIPPLPWTNLSPPFSIDKDVKRLGLEQSAAVRFRRRAARQDRQDQCSPMVRRLQQDGPRRGELGAARVPADHEPCDCPWSHRDEPDPGPKEESAFSPSQRRYLCLPKGRLEARPEMGGESQRRSSRRSQYPIHVGLHLPGVRPKRAVAHPVPWTQVCLTRRA